MMDSRIGTSPSRVVLITSMAVSAGSLPVRADLLLHYDFNDASDPFFVFDESGNNNDAEVLGAQYTPDGGGRTGEDGDRALDFKGAGDGAHINVLTALDGAFDTINEDDAATIALWVRGGASQPHNNSVFWFSGTVEDRVLQAHVPWGNGTVYFDVGGCCAAATPANRISAGTEEHFYKGRWNHYAFVKDEARTAIYQNGELFLESGPGAEMVSLESLFITNVDFGSAMDGGNSYNGLIDDVYVYDEPLSPEDIEELAESDREDLGPNVEMVSFAPFLITNVVFGSSLGGSESYHGLIDDIGVWDGPLSLEEIQDLAESEREDLLIARDNVRMRVGDQRQLRVTHIAADGFQTRPELPLRFGPGSGSALPGLW